MFGRKTVPLHPEDQKLLEIAAELCGQLNFNAHPQTINWMERGGFRRVPPDYAMIVRRGPYAGSIYLSEEAMGKLTPEEWRPLLASTIAYYGSLTRGMLGAMLPMFAIYLLGPVIIVASFRFFDSAELAPIRYLLLALTFVLIGLGFAIMSRRMKSLYFKADRQAAELVGKDPLMKSLMKIDSINQSTSARRTGRVRPTLGERINRLTNFQQA